MGNLHTIKTEIYYELKKKIHTTFSKFKNPSLMYPIKTL